MELAREIEVSIVLEEMAPGIKAPMIWLKTSCGRPLSDEIEDFTSLHWEWELRSCCCRSGARGERPSRTFGRPNAENGAVAISERLFLTSYNAFSNVSESFLSLDAL